MRFLCVPVWGRAGYIGRGGESELRDGREQSQADRYRPDKLWWSMRCVGHGGTTPAIIADDVMEVHNALSDGGVCLVCFSFVFLFFCFLRFSPFQQSKNSLFVSLPTLTPFCCYALLLLLLTNLSLLYSTFSNLPTLCLSLSFPAFTSNFPTSKSAASWSPDVLRLPPPPPPGAPRPVPRPRPLPDKTRHPCPPPCCYHCPLPSCRAAAR